MWASIRNEFRRKRRGIKPRKIIGQFGFASRLRGVHESLVQQDFSVGF
jgi:hypothetical protein